MLLYPALRDRGSYAVLNLEVRRLISSSLKRRITGRLSKTNSSDGPSF